MLPQDLIDAARAQALRIERTRAPLPDAFEALRRSCRELLPQVPEPPLYRRPGDSSRATAESLLEPVRGLLAQAIALERDGGGQALQPLRSTLEAHLTALCHLAAGRLGPAEDAWREAVSQEPQALGGPQAFVRSPHPARRPVYDRAQGTSRYDPGPEPTLSARLACPRPACRRENVFTFSPRYATHTFTCPACRVPFVGYFGEAVGVEVTPHGKQRRHYAFKVNALQGGLSRVEGEALTAEHFPVRARELLAFLYDGSQDLRGVVNLTTGRILWMARTGPCFLATAAYGPDHPALDHFRRLRDERLRPHLLGRAFIRAYYAVGPTLARGVARTPGAPRLVRAALDALFSPGEAP